MNRRASSFADLSVIVGCAVAALALAGHPALAQPDLSALVEQMPDADGDGKYTGPAPEDAEKVYEAVLRGGKDSIVQLVGMLVEPGKGDDYKARYVLHGLAIYVGRPGAEAQGRMLGDALISTLGGGAPKDVKRFVIQELQFLGEARAVEAIGQFLLDEALCDDAALALVAIGRGAGAVLAEALPGARGSSRLAIIQALGEVRHSDSVRALIPILRDNASDHRVAAAAALSKIGHPRAAEALIQALEPAKGYERIQMFDACFVLAENLLRAGRQAEASRMYSRIWKAMSDQPEPQMRHAVAEALAVGLSPLPTAQLIGRLKSDDPATRAAIVHVLGRRDDPTAFGAVAAAMSDKDPGVRLIAISSVGPVGRERSVPVLIASLPGESLDAARALWTALLTVPGEEANEALATGLADVPDGPASSAVRMLLLDVLTERRATEGAEAAFRLTSDEDVAVRVKALQSLAVLADGKYAARLAELLPKVENQEELKALEDALVATCRRIPDEMQRVEPLLPVLASTDVQSRCLLLRAVGRMGAAASVSVLLEALKDDDTQVRDAAMRALSDFPNDRPAPELLEIAKTTDNADHHGLALRGYVRMAEQKKANEEKVRMLGEAMDAARGVEEKKLVLETMGKISSAEALMAAVSYLTDPELANPAGRAAVRIARGMKGREADKVRQAMQKVLEHAKSQQVRKSAEEVLATVQGG